MTPLVLWSAFFSPFPFNFPSFSFFFSFHLVVLDLCSVLRHSRLSPERQSWAELGLLRLIKGRRRAWNDLLGVSFCPESFFVFCAYWAIVEICPAALILLFDSVLVLCVPLLLI